MGKFFLMKYFSPLIFKLFVAFLLISVSVQGMEVNYKISTPEPHTHYVEVEMDVRDFKGTEMDVKMPVWAPGSYLVREFAKSVEDFSANTNGKPLEVKKVNKNTWRIYKGKKDKVVIKYRVYAFELSVRTSYVDVDHAYFNGTSIFMYVKDNLDATGNLTIVPHKNWKKVNTGLAKVEGSEWVRSYPHYDILVDSPIEIGNQLTFDFTAAGVKHTVAMFGEGNYNVETLKKDMARIIETTSDIFGFNPNKEYTFIIHNLTQGSGGLEHLNSTTLQVDRWTYEGAKYDGFLSLVAHEYFHLWNVKRIRPINLGPFNYDGENYTPLLWIMEGFTSYYDELILQRSGDYSKDTYIRKMAGTATRVENQPGNKVLPVSESSLDAWVKLYRPNENSYNTTISYYSKGSLVAMVLDLEIIHSTHGEKSLDDVLIYLYKEYYEKKGRGFTPEEARMAIEHIAGKNLDEIFNKYINGTETIDYAKYFNYAGLNVVDANENNNNSSFGVFTKEEDGKLLVSTVVRNTTAYEGQLSVNDELIAINGKRVNKANMSSIFDMYRVGDEINVLVSRDGMLRTLTMTVKKDPSVKYVVEAQEDMSEDQRKVLDKWLR